MPVHRISLVTALVLLGLAFVFVVVAGPAAFLLLAVVLVLLWYAFGPGAHGSNFVTTS